MHHDEYYSRTSQRKGLSWGEVAAFRNELYAAVGKAFSQPVHFGEVLVPERDPYAGQYIRLGGNSDSAELTLTPVGDGRCRRPRYAVIGLAYWGTDRKSGPHTGELAFIGTLEDDGIITQYQRNSREGEAHFIKITLHEHDLILVEENWDGAYGMNVNFKGEYRHAECWPPRPATRSAA